jgi:hypothetical protein
MIPDEMPPVQSMEAVDLHLRAIMRELRDIKGSQETMLDKLATKTEMENMRASLQRQIDAVTPRSIVKRATEYLVFLTVFAAFVGVLIAVFRWAKV